MKLSKKNKTALLIGFIILVMGGVGFALWDSRRKKNPAAGITDQEVKDNGNNILTTGENLPDPTPFDGEKILSFGTKSKEVLMAQRTMNNLAKSLNAAFPLNATDTTAVEANFSVTGFDFELLVEDGNFGAKTQAYVFDLLGKNQASFNEILVEVLKESNKLNNILNS